MLSEPQTQTCPICGRAIATWMPEGLCAACLARQALTDFPKVLGQEKGPMQPLISLRFFGDYELLEEIGRGGMGVVFRARQLGVKRIVALKVLTGGAAAGREFVHRFHTEAAAAAGLSHPHIVPIYEFGEHEGAHFLAMRFIEGGTLQMRAQQVLAPVDAARLISTIAASLQYAHEHGVLHRDLKPGNILIDKDGQPYVADFGLARVSAEDSDLTVSNAVLGTAPYLAPEVAARGAGAATTASDTYGLGAILYELLAGRAPFTGATIAEVLRTLQESEPLLPSQVVAKRKSSPGGTFPSLDDARDGKGRRSGHEKSVVRIPRDLETICLKCLDKEPAKRYGTARELADDLNRFLRNEPILARPADPVEKVWRWCRRKPVVAGLLAALLLGFAVGLAGVLWQWGRAERNATNEVRARQMAQAESYTADMNLVVQAWEEGNLRRAQDLLWQHVPGPGEQDLRGFEWRYLWKLCQDESRLTITNPPTDRTWAVEAPIKSNFILARGERGVRLLAGDTGRELDRFVETDTNREITASAFSAIATNIVAVGDNKGTLSLWDLKAKAVLWSFRAHTKAVVALAFSPDGGFLASTDAGDVGGGTLKIWNAVSVEGTPSNARWTNHLDHLCPALLFTPDGKTLVSAGKQENEGRLAAWDMNAGRPLEPFPKQHFGYVLCMAFSPDGKFLAASGLQPAIFIWDFAARRVVTRLSGHIGSVNSLAFFSDGRRLVSGGEDNTIRIWDIPTKSEVNLLRGHRESVHSVVLSPDERCIFSASGDQIKVWTVEWPGRAQTLETHQSWVVPGISPDGKWLVTAEYQNPTTIKVWDFASRQFRFNLYTLPEAASLPSFSPDSALLAVGCEDRNVYIWDTAGWGRQVTPSNPIQIITNKFEPTAVPFSPDGRILAAASTVMSPRVEPSHARNRLAFWEVGTWRKLNLLPRAGEAESEQSAGVSPNFSPDGHTLGIGYKDGLVRLWDFKRDELLSEFKDHDAGLGYFTGTSFSKDGHWLSTWSQHDSGVVVRDIHDLRQPRKVASWTCNHIGGMWEAILDPDNRTLVSSGNDGRIKFWNLMTQQVALTLKHGEGPGGLFSFTPDGNLLVSWDAHGTFKFWPAAPFAEVPKTRAVRGGITQ